MNILEQLKLAKSNAPLGIKVSTLGELKMAEEFEFATARDLSVGDMIEIGLQYQPAYGLAVIVRDPGNGLYVGKRTG